MEPALSTAPTAGGTSSPSSASAAAAAPVARGAANEPKIALVTGGASGLGESTVRALLNAGYLVLALDMNAEAGAALEAELGATRLAFHRADVASEADVRAALVLARERFGAATPLRLVVNCAGVATAQKVLSSQGVLGIDVFEFVMRVNVTGTFNVLRLAVELMAKQAPDFNGERGTIVNVASIAAYDAQQGQCAYAASKGAIVSMTLPLAREFAPLGIRINSICPGTMDTPMLARLPDRAKAAIAKDIPLARFGSGAEFAALVLHIAANTYLTGESIRLDGGVRLPKL